MNIIKPSTVPAITEWDKRITSIGSYNEIKEMADVVDEISERGLDIWNWFRDCEPPKNEGYMWWDHPYKKLIMQHPDIQKSGHSGGSMACCFRNIQCISKIGFEKWQELCLNDINKNK